MKLRVLTVGNSFSICLGKNLPQIVRAGRKHQLELTSAYIGGCSLQTHAEHLGTAAKDVAFSPYRIDIWHSSDMRKHRRYAGNVLNLLKNNTYDIVTVQQASPASWDFATYYPWADCVIKTIQKYNPSAKILIQETWSYRSDSERLTTWGFDNVKMYEKLKEAYCKFAAKTGFEVIPTGDAIELFRKRSGRTYTALSEEERAKFLPPDLPPMANDIVGRDFYVKDETGELSLRKDCIHLNFRGEYLQSCVWYGKLFGENPEDIIYERQDMAHSESLLMQKCAKDALYSA